MAQNIVCMVTPTISVRTTRRDSAKLRGATEVGTSSLVTSIRDTNILCTQASAGKAWKRGDHEAKPCFNAMPMVGLQKGFDVRPTEAAARPSVIDTGCLHFEYSPKWKSSKHHCRASPLRDGNFGHPQSSYSRASFSEPLQQRVCLFFHLQIAYTLVNRVHHSTLRQLPSWRLCSSAPRGARHMI